MPVTVQQQASGKILAVTATGKLSTADYQHFVPQIEAAIQKFGKIRIIFRMIEFHGWEVAALWADIKFDAKHFNQIERIAMVGDKTWEHGMALFCKPFTTAQTHYFESKDSDEAQAWIESDQ